MLGLAAGNRRAVERFRRHQRPIARRLTGLAAGGDFSGKGIGRVGLCAECIGAQRAERLRSRDRTGGADLAAQRQAADTPVGKQSSCQLGAIRRRRTATASRIGNADCFAGQGSRRQGAHSGGENPGAGIALFRDRRRLLAVERIRKDGQCQTERGCPSICRGVARLSGCRSRDFVSVCAYHADQLRPSDLPTHPYRRRHARCQRTGRPARLAACAAIFKECDCGHSGTGNFHAKGSFMTTPMEYDIDDDVIDKLAGLPAGSQLHALRHQREKVAVASQGSYDSLFDPALEGIGLDERLLVALYACRLAGAQDVAAHYRARLYALPADAAQIAVAADGAPERLPEGRLRAMLAFARALTERPIEGNEAFLHPLPAAGISTPAVGALAQLIAFVSYQLRVVAGLKPMKSASNQAGTA